MSIFSWERWKWFPHNVIAHPLSELFFQLGWHKLSDYVHDATVPRHDEGTGRG
jgi:hypothetical protein